jgi:hypothetical protein
MMHWQVDQAQQMHVAHLMQLLHFSICGSFMIYKAAFMYSTKYTKNEN